MCIRDSGGPGRRVGDLRQCVSVCADGDAVDARPVIDAGPDRGQLAEAPEQWESARHRGGAGAVFPADPAPVGDRFHPEFLFRGDRAGQHGDDRHAAGGRGLAQSAFWAADLWDPDAENDRFPRRGAGVPAHARADGPRGQQQDDPAHQPAGGHYALGHDHHADGAALRAGCGVRRGDQCADDRGVHPDHAADGVFVPAVKGAKDGETRFFVEM